MRSLWPAFTSHLKERIVTMVCLAYTLAFLQEYMHRILPKKKMKLANKNLMLCRCFKLKKLHFLQTYLNVFGYFSSYENIINMLQSK